MEFYKRIKMQVVQPGTQEFILPVMLPSTLGPIGTPSGPNIISFHIDTSRIGIINRLTNWLPRNRPLPGEDFCRVDRSIDELRLAGGYYTDLSVNPSDLSASHAVRRLQMEGHRPDVLLVPSDRLKAWKASLPVQNSASPGVQTNTLNLIGCQIEIIEEPTLQDVSFLLTKSSWGLLVTDGPIPGSTRVIPYCNAPGANYRIDHKLPLAKPPAQWKGVQDEINRVTAKVLQPRCECGSEAVGSPMHSSWCPVK